MVRQAFVAKMLWLGYSVDHIAERGASARIIGNKTPQIERKYRILENMFRHAPPRYVYCLRAAPKVLRSVKNLSNLRWNRDSVETNLKRYIKSVECLEEMQAAFPIGSASACSTTSPGDPQQRVLRAGLCLRRRRARRRGARPARRHGRAEHHGGGQEDDRKPGRRHRGADPRRDALYFRPPKYVEIREKYQLAC